MEADTRNVRCYSLASLNGANFEPRVPRPSRASCRALRAAYPGVHCELDHGSLFQLLVTTILSAQYTDVRVNLVTPALFQRYPDAARMAAAEQEDIEKLIHSTGFFRSKAKNIRLASAALVAHHGGVEGKWEDEGTMGRGVAD